MKKFKIGKNRRCCLNKYKNNFTELGRKKCQY
jgi:hypothetical protein